MHGDQGLVVVGEDFLKLSSLNVLHKEVRTHYLTL
jgi:hypothetical protein